MDLLRVCSYLLLLLGKHPRHYQVSYQPIPKLINKKKRIISKID